MKIVEALFYAVLWLLFVSGVTAACSITFVVCRAVVRVIV